MNRTAQVFVLAVLFAMLAAPANAQGPGWLYLEGGYKNIDLDDVDLTVLDEEGDGWFVGGSTPFGRSLHLFGRYSESETDLNIEFEEWYAGVGWHGLLGSRADLFAEVAYLERKVSVFKEDSVFGRVGVRFRPIHLIELRAAARAQDVDDIGDEFVYEGDAIVYLGGRLGVGLNVEIEESIETYNVYLRLSSGRR